MKSKKQKRKERKQYIVKVTSKDLDVRQRHLGIRQIQNGYKPQTYHFKDEETKEHVNIHDNAEYASNHLEKKVWGDTHPQTAKIRAEQRSKEQIIKQNLKYNTDPRNLKESKSYLKKSKRRKAPGPDDTPWNSSWKWTTTT